MIAAYVAARRLQAHVAIAAVLAAAVLFVAPASAHAISVCIDPGHGGPYSNSNHNGLYEKSVNLWIAEDLRTELMARGHTVVMTRRTDRAVCLSDIPTWNWSDASGWSYAADGITRYSSIPKDDLQARVDIANDAGVDLFISVHNNGAAATSARGYETHSSRLDALSQRLKVLVQEEVIRETGLRDRGVRSNDFYVVRWTNMPAILIEGAYISNPSDAALLKDYRFRRRLARGVARGVERWLAEDPYKPRFERIAGADRYDTAARISAATWPSGASAAVLVSGDAHAEALVAAPLAAKLGGPVLLTRASGIPTYTALELARLRPAQVVIVGGSDTVSDTVLAAAAAAASIDPSAVRRIGGADRYQTAALVANEVGVGPTTTPFLASGERLADALSIATPAAEDPSPILLTSLSGMPTCTADFLATHPYPRLYVAGGTLAVPETQTAGLAKVFRLAGRDRYETNTRVLDLFYIRYGTSSTLRPYAANGQTFIDALTIAGKASREGRHVMLTGGRTMSPSTRLWITRNRPAVTSFTMVGGTLAQPYLMDWMLLKADTE